MYQLLSYVLMCGGNISGILEFLSCAEAPPCLAHGFPSKRGLSGDPLLNQVDIIAIIPCSGVDGPQEERFCTATGLTATVKFTLMICGRAGLFCTSWNQRSLQLEVPISVATLHEFCAPRQTQG